MSRILKALVVAITFSGFVAPPMVGPAFGQQLAAMSTEDWYRLIEATRKKTQDHPWVSAVIKGINAGAGEMTISHGPIPHARMSAMTMTFPVREASDLTAHQVGDHISIQVAEDGGVVKIVHVRSSKRR
jgi:Cu/Ag efflux protein CusF